MTLAPSRPALVCAQRIHSRCHLALIAFLLLAVCVPSEASALPAAQDSSSAGGKLTLLANKASTLRVDAASRAHIRFDLAELPPATAAQIHYARLRIYLPKVVKKGGGLSVHVTTGEWDEAQAGTEPTFEQSAAGTIGPLALIGKRFASVDVTAAVKAWVSGTKANRGFAIAAVDGASVLISAKEGTGSGYPAELEVGVNPPETPLSQLGPDLTLTGTTTGKFSGDGSGLTGLNVANLGVLSADQLPATLNLGRVVNAKHFGARGDGVMDDSAAIAEAVGAVAGTGGTVFLPAGLYLCNVTLPSAITLQGAMESSQAPGNDATRTRLKPFTPGEPVIRVPSSKGVRIKDLALFGPGAYVPGSTGIRIAADAPSTLGVFAGYSTILEGVQCSGFETGYFISSYRVLALQCAGMRCKYNWFLSNPPSGAADPTPDTSGYPSDHLTLINCVAAFPREVSAGVEEAAPNRTSYGIYANSVRGLTLLGCDVGQCGTGVYLQSCMANLSCHVEGTDGPALHVSGSGVHVSSVSTLHSGGILGEGAGVISISALSADGAYAGGPAFIGIKGPLMSVKSELPRMVKYMDPAGALVGYSMSNGARVGLVRQSPQTISKGNVWTEVLWNATQFADAVESGPQTNYSTSTGRWKCPLGGRYRFQFVLSKHDPAGGRFFTKINERTGGNVSRDFTVNAFESGADGKPLAGSITIDCFQGRTYSLAVSGESQGSIQVGGGASPTSGDAISRMSIAPE